MLHDKRMPQYLWGGTVNTTVYLMNRHSTVAVEGKTPFEAWSGRKPFVNHLRMIGDVLFSEKSSWDWNQATIREESALIIIEEENQLNEEEIKPEIPQLSPENIPQVHSSTPSSPSSTPVRLRSLNEVYESCNLCVEEPENFDVVKEDTWKAAMQEEINVIVKNKT
ncbi:hypothetical protein ACFX1S_007644 [Malus domestica]